MTARFWLCLLAASLLVATTACDDDGDSDPTTDTQQADTTTPQGDATNASDATNVSDATSTGDATATPDGTAGDTTTGPPYAEYTFPTCENHTSTDDIAPGMYTFTEACIGTNPYEAITLLCPNSLLIDPPTPTVTARGSLLVGDDGNFARHMFIDVTGTLWATEACVTGTLGGSCAEAENFLGALGGNATCAEDTDNGGCLCDVTGTASFRQAGHWTGSAGSYNGTFINNTGELVSLDITVDDLDDGTIGTTELERGDSQRFTFDGAPSACQNYCMFFMGVCRDVDGVTGYTDIDDCMTQCATLTATDEPLPVSSGDSVECRATHARLAADPTDMGNAATHCPHAQFAATAPCN